VTGRLHGCGECTDKGPPTALTPVGPTQLLVAVFPPVRTACQRCLSDLEHASCTTVPDR
jgi:hypothetical protein